MVNLAVKESAALANIPEHLRADVGSVAGRDNIGRDDVLIPRLCVAQKLSPQLNKKKEEYIEDLEEGDIFNSVTGEIYGTAVTVIPLFFFKQFIEFKPKGEGGGLGGIVRMYGPGELPPAEDLAFGPNQTAPKCTEFKNRMSLLLKDDGSVEPIIVSFKSTGMKAARKWNFLIQEKPFAAYAFQYELSSVDQSKNGNDFKGLSVKRGDFTPAAVYEKAKEYFENLESAGFKVDTSGLDHEQEATTGDSPF